MDDLREFGGSKRKLGGEDVVKNDMSKLISFSYLGEKRMTLVACFQRDWVRLEEAEDVVDEFD